MKSIFNMNSVDRDFKIIEFVMPTNHRVIKHS